MDPTTFARLPLPANLVIFAGAAVFVWMAGIRLTGYAKTIAERTGAEQAFVGILLLGTPSSYSSAFDRGIPQTTMLVTDGLDASRESLIAVNKGGLVRENSAD